MEPDEEKPEAANQHRVSDKIELAILDARRIFLSGGVDSKMAEEAIKKIWYLEVQDPGKPILVIINSPGGSVDAGLAIWDQLKMITSPVTTLITGIAASMGSILALAAAPGRRFATPKSRIMIHQPAIAGVIQGQATDLEIQAKEILKTKEMIIAMYVAATGKSADAIEKSIDRDTWMSAEEALAFGLIDKIVTSQKDL
jgi:ATP-dependent Clp protease, protease subunit